jgi:adenine-specific DNA-methyltransferase
MIKYLGSKRALLEVIVNAIGSRAGGATVLDLFSGTSRVGHALKGRGHRVIANDHNAYAHVLARCYVAADLEDVRGDAERLIKEFNGLRGVPGYFTETFCERSRFFQPHNGERIDAIREAIAGKGLEPHLEAVLLVSLMEAADRVDSTAGLQMAFLKQWAARSHRTLELRMPAVLGRISAGRCEAHRMDALEAAGRFDVGVAYLDPPYNQHSYLGNYHIWETLVRWDKPEVYGIACKRVDVRDRRSLFNSRPGFRPAMEAILAAICAPLTVVSFSNEGYLDRAEFEQMLGGMYGGRARVETLEMDYKRYVGAQIGIHDRQGRKVGKVSHLRNKEYLFVVSNPRKRAAARARVAVSARQISCEIFKKL